MTTTPTEPTHPSDTPDTIQTDLLCISCGYNLRTLKHTGLCPECAKPVRESMLSGGVQAFLRKLRHGITWLVVTLGISATLTILRFVIQELSPDWLNVLIPPQIMFWIWTICGFAWCVGILLATRSTLQNPLHDRTATLRLSIRILVVVLLLAYSKEFVRLAIGFWIGNILAWSTGIASSIAHTTVAVCLAIYLSRHIAQWQISLVRLARCWIGMSLLTGIASLTSIILNFYWYVLRPAAGTTSSQPQPIETLLSAVQTTYDLLALTTTIIALIFFVKCRKTLSREITQR